MGELLVAAKGDPDSPGGKLLAVRPSLYFLCSACLFTEIEADSDSDNAVNAAFGVPSCLCILRAF